MMNSPLQSFGESVHWWDFCVNVFKILFMKKHTRKNKRFLCYSSPMEAEGRGGLQSDSRKSVNICILSIMSRLSWDGAPLLVFTHSEKCIRQSTFLLYNLAHSQGNIGHIQTGLVRNKQWLTFPCRVMWLEEALGILIYFALLGYRMHSLPVVPAK